MILISDTDVLEFNIKYQLEVQCHVQFLSLPFFSEQPPFRRCCCRFVSLPHKQWLSLTHLTSSSETLSGSVALLFYWQAKIYLEMAIPDKRNTAQEREKKTQIVQEHRTALFKKTDQCQNCGIKHTHVFWMDQCTDRWTSARCLYQRDNTSHAHPAEKWRRNEINEGSISLCCHSFVCLTLKQFT